MPLVGALAKYKEDHGDYPKKLDELIPKYIAALPAVKPVISPPEFHYRYEASKSPVLVFEATGQFAHYTYDFEERKWVYLD